MTETSSQPSTSPSQPATAGQWLRNLSVAIVAIVLSVAVFFGFHTQTSTATLATLAEEATPLEVALDNRKPTLMEFYANWCLSCQAMASELGTLKQQYSDRVNFVMLNVDNSKWLPEMLNYEVNGIPHFVFLDAEGETQGEALGEPPQSAIAANLEALIAGSRLPYGGTSGKVSNVDTTLSPNRNSADDPRSHGSQVVN